MALVAEVANHEQFPVRGGKAVQGVVKLWSEAFPSGIGLVGFSSWLHDKGFLFAALAIGVLADLIQNGKARGTKKPAVEGGLPGNAARLLRQGDEDDLGRLFRRVGIAGLAQGGVIDHAGVTLHQGAERLFGMVDRVVFEELPVVHSSFFLLINSSPGKNVTPFRRSSMQNHGTWPAGPVSGLSAAVEMVMVRRVQTISSRHDAPAAARRCPRTQKQQP